VQWFDNGGVEIFSDVFHRSGHGVHAESTSDYRAMALTRWAREKLPAAAELIETRLGVSGPYAIAISIVGIKGRKIVDVPAMSDLDSSANHRFDREPLFPASEVAQGAGDVLTACNKVLDSVWRSAGYPGAP
jgi:hypothetical protein